ncbi:MAG TPA: TfoX/Sxy family protein [Rhizomicrobium sp.]
MAGSKPDPHRFDDLFAQFGTIALRRFFGGEGICVGETMIGMVFADIIYFKTDQGTRPAFLAEKSMPFTFLKRSTGDTVVTSWYALPDRLYDDPEELARWARAALDAVEASAAAKTRVRKAATRSKTSRRRAPR